MNESDLKIIEVISHKFRNGNLYLKVKWNDSDIEPTWELESNISQYRNKIVEKYFNDHDLATELQQKNQLNDRKIAEIVGIFPNPKNDGILYVVRPEDEVNYLIVPSYEIQQKDPEKLIDFLENHLIFDNHTT